jgi:alkylation response protein AidB-like acyl-CoA dehydrogenase
MDFGFSEEQEMLRDAAKRFLADNCPTTFVRKMMAHETAHDPEFYKKLVELGWPGLLIPEQYGGTGGTFLDLTVIMEETGKALLPGPFFATALLGAPLILEGGSEAQKNELLPKIAAGDLLATLTPAESGSRRKKKAAATCFPAKSCSFPTLMWPAASRWRRARSRVPTRSRGSACCWCRPTPRA